MLCLAVRTDAAICASEKSGRVRALEPSLRARERAGGDRQRAHSLASVKCEARSEGAAAQVDFPPLSPFVRRDFPPARPPSSTSRSSTPRTRTHSRRSAAAPLSVVVVVVRTPHYSARPIVLHRAGFAPLLSPTPRRHHGSQGGHHAPQERPAVRLPSPAPPSFPAPEHKLTRTPPRPTLVLPPLFPLDSPSPPSQSARQCLVPRSARLAPQGRDPRPPRLRVRRANTSM